MFFIITKNQDGSMILIQIKYIEKVSIYFKKKFLEFNLNNDMIT